MRLLSTGYSGASASMPVEPGEHEVGASIEATFLLEMG